MGDFLYFTFVSAFVNWIVVSEIPLLSLSLYSFSVEVKVCNF